MNLKGYHQSIKTWLNSFSSIEKIAGQSIQKFCQLFIAYVGSGFGSGFDSRKFSVPVLVQYFAM